MCEIPKELIRYFKKDLVRRGRVKEREEEGEGEREGEGEGEKWKIFTWKNSNPLRAEHRSKKDEIPCS